MTFIVMAEAESGAAAAISAQDAGNGGPAIECHWLLPDMQASVNDATYPDPRVQYRDASDSGAHDSDALLAPDTGNGNSNGTQAPCASDSDTTGALRMPAGVRHLAQVLPNTANSPEERIFQVWAAVGPGTAASGMDAVSWTAYRPDGSFHARVEGTLIPATGLDLLGGPATPGGMFEAAARTGQVAAGTVDGLLARVERGETSLYAAYMTVLDGAPCGEYRVEITASTGEGPSSTTDGYFDVVCSYFYDVDVRKVFWGTIGSVGTKTVPGDTKFLVGLSPATTLLNTGGAGMAVGVKFGLMHQVDQFGDPLPDGASIDTFTAAYGIQAGSLDWIDPVHPDTDYWFGATNTGLLCPGQAARLDMSVVGNGSVAGLYGGVITILSRISFDCPES
jgi:hypothetical protein